MKGIWIHHSDLRGFHSEELDYLTAKNEEVHLLAGLYSCVQTDGVPWRLQQRETASGKNTKIL